MGVRWFFGTSGVVVFFGRVAGLVARLPLALRPLSVEVGYLFVRDGSVGGIGAGRLCKVHDNDEVDVASAQCSCAPFVGW